jgi:predicted O-methyltransferase YrrM
MNLYPVGAYLRHLLTARSTAGHGVHSPYIYDFLTKVIRNKTDVKIVNQVVSLRRTMLSDKRSIMVTDLGAGSVTRAGGERRVAEIARTAALPAKEAGLLSRIVKSMEHAGDPPDGGETVPQSGRALSREQGARTTGHGARSGENGIILELGTSLGISTLALALAAPERRVITVEGCPVLAAIARENLLKYGAANAEVLAMEFSAAIESLRNEGLSVSFAFIDGNHRGTALTEYVSKIASMGEDMIIVADDIRLTKEMFRAWRSVAASGIATVSMETLRLGILFIKHGITPGRYRIRY